jgi:hypothetical protein
VIVPTLLFFFRLKHVANGSSGVIVTFGDFQTLVPPNRFLAFSLDGVGLSAEKSITILCAPAKFVEVAVSLILFRTARWYPTSLLPGLWRSLIYPIYALPAWIYAGRGIDAILRRTEVRRSNMVASLILALSSLVLCCGLRFGLSPTDRQGLTDWYIKGFALWAVFFALPLTAWLTRKTKAAARDLPLP